MSCQISKCLVSDCKHNDSHSCKRKALKYDLSITRRITSPMGILVTHLSLSRKDCHAVKRIPATSR